MPVGSLQPFSVGYNKLKSCLGETSVKLSAAALQQGSCYEWKKRDEAKQEDLEGQAGGIASPFPGMVADGGVQNQAEKHG